ncbi:hypothetical protein SCLCIDRAFT_1221100 [Scleroderma citrinum Foug A]|uniref:Uncharacterized protein n=1 Tax=Scleroderma citrinum Foug A TaxID=1036808 RepID=A0A0C3DH48_9AGAM|nr:hypothetical protein SCLCIDRAFT_1221100 [Scleroderma citrinum Foug A]
MDSKRSNSNLRCLSAHCPLWSVKPWSTISVTSHSTAATYVVATCDRIICQLMLTRQNRYVATWSPPPQ